MLAHLILRVGEWDDGLIFEPCCTTEVTCLQSCGSLTRHNIQKGSERKPGRERERERQTETKTERTKETNKKRNKYKHKEIRKEREREEAEKEARAVGIRWHFVAQVKCFWSCLTASAMAPASMLLVWPSFIFGHVAPQFDWPLKALSFVYDVFVSCCFWLCFLFPYRFHLGFLKLLLQQVLAMPASKSLFSHHLDASTTVDEKLWFSASKNWGAVSDFCRKWNGVRQYHCLDTFSASKRIAHTFEQHNFCAVSYDIKGNALHDITSRGGFMELLDLGLRFLDSGVMYCKGFIFLICCLLLYDFKLCN